MPIYEYRCPNCSNIFEKLISWEAFKNQKSACPKCNTLCNFDNRIISHSSHIMSGNFTNIKKFQKKNEDLKKRNSFK